MRLICPNCGAQYEVPPEAVPPGGRDVQCSNCGHTWFVGATPVPAVAPPADAPGRDPSRRAGTDAAEPPAEDAFDDLGLDDPDDDDPGPPPEPPVEAPRARRSVSPEVAEILRAEAQREAEARSAEARSAEARAAEARRRVATPAAALGEDGADGRDGPRPASASAPAPAPPDLLSDPLAEALATPAAERERQRAEEARRRMARLRGEAAPHTSAVVPPGPPARRDRLPDIEEINSTLRGAADRAAPARAGAQPAARGGFGLGFGGALLLAAVLALLYVYAPRITAALPATGAVLRPYAAAVDGGRLWLDDRLQALLRRVGDGAAEGGEGPGPATASPAAAPAAGQAALPAPPPPDAAPAAP